MSEVMWEAMQRMGQSDKAAALCLVLLHSPLQTELLRAETLPDQRHGQGGH